MVKQIESIELIALDEGAAAIGRTLQLRYEANTHQNSSNQKQENAYWDNWAIRFEKCVGVV